MDERPPEERSCAVVGAGISGLAAARELQQAGWRVTVLEQGGEVGGRMAARRFGGGTFDCGAQFFTVRSERFAELVEEWLAAGVVREWCRGFAGPDGTPNEDGYPRYRGAEDMASVPRHLARGLDVRTGERVVGLSPGEAGWTVTSASGLQVSARAAILTGPAPRSLALAKTSGVLPEETRSALRRISYDPCLALLALLDGPSGVPEPGGVQIKGEPLDWVADNQKKGISQRPAVTIHTGPRWSREHFDDAEREVTGSLLEFAAPWFSAGVEQTELVRWPHSWVASGHPEPCLRTPGDPPLVFCGDAFGDPRVEGATLSGLAAAGSLLDLLRR